MRTIRVVAGLLAVIATGCATMRVSSYVQPGTSLAQYRTWDWQAADALPTGDPRLDNNGIFKDHLEGAVERELRARSLERVTNGTPDLRVHYHLNVRQRVDVTSTTDAPPSACRDEACVPRMMDYEAATIVLDLTDARTDTLIWRGWTQDRLQNVIDDQQQMERYVDRAVQRMMAQLPVTPVTRRADLGGTPSPRSAVSSR